MVLLVVSVLPLVVSGCGCLRRMPTLSCVRVDDLDHVWTRGTAM